MSSVWDEIEGWTEQYLEEIQGFGSDQLAVIAEGIQTHSTTSQLLEELDTDEEGLGYMLSSFNDKWKDFCIDEAIYELEMYSSGFSLESIDGRRCWKSGLSYS